MSALFSPLQLRGLALSNRIMVSPMCQYSAVDGEATDWHFTHINSLALSGAAMFCIEATACGSDRPHHAGLPRAVERCHRSGAEADHRLGAQAFQGCDRDAARACRPQGLEPHAVGWRAVDSDVRRRLADGRAFRGAAQGRRGAAAGARCGGTRAHPRGVRLRCEARRAARVSTRSSCIARTAICCTSSCRRSPTGAPTNMAAALQTACGFRWKCSTRCAPHFPRTKPVGVRVSSTDWVEGGWDMEQTIEVAERTEKARRRLDRCFVRRRLPKQKIPLGPGYQVPFAEEIKQARVSPRSRSA